MNIKRSILFSLKGRTYKGKKITTNLPIRMRVSYNSQRLEIPIGYSIDLAKWDTETLRVKKNAYSKKKESYSDINSYLSKAEYEMDETFKEFETKETMPTRAELEKAFWARMSAAKGSAGEKTIQRKTNNFWEAFEEFKNSERISTNNNDYSNISKGISPYEFERVMNFGAGAAKYHFCSGASHGGEVGR